MRVYGLRPHHKACVCSAPTHRPYQLMPRCGTEELMAAGAYLVKLPMWGPAGKVTCASCPPCAASTARGRRRGPSPAAADGQEPQTQLARSSSAWHRAVEKGARGCGCPGSSRCSHTSLPAPTLVLTFLSGAQGRTCGFTALPAAKGRAPDRLGPFSRYPRPVSPTLMRICRSSRSLPSHLSKGSRSCRRWLVGLTSTRCPLLSLGGCW